MLQKQESITKFGKVCLSRIYPNHTQQRCVIVSTNDLLACVVLKRCVYMAYMCYVTLIGLCGFIATNKEHILCSDATTAAMMYNILVKYVMFYEMYV